MTGKTRGGPATSDLLAVASVSDEEHLAVAALPYAAAHLVPGETPCSRAIGLQRHLSHVFITVAKNFISLSNALLSTLQWTIPNNIQQLRFVLADDRMSQLQINEPLQLYDSPILLCIATATDELMS